MKYMMIFLLMFLNTAVLAAGVSIDERCNLLSERHIESFKKDLLVDYALIDTESFYSEKVDSCIHVERTLVGVKVQIRDLSKSVIIDGEKHFNLLLNCDVDGTDSVILDTVKKYRGRVYSVPFEEWLDDGFGGLPATLKPSKHAYTKDQCGQMLQKWMSILKE